MEAEGLLRSLKEHKVRFVIIGATAFPVHGYSRATLDIDIFIEPTLRNAERTRDALKAFGYDMSDASVDDLLTKKLLQAQTGKVRLEG
jgi:predicted nucleotidyltransferase